MKKSLGPLFTLVLAASLLVVPATTSVADVAADTVYINGKIYTADAAFSVAEAMAIKGDRFLYVGTNQGTARYTSGKTTVIDLKGRTVLPGLMDSHNHFGSVGTNLFSKDINCYWLPLDKLQAAIAAAVQNPAVQRPGGQGWIVCRGYNDAIWDPPVAHKGLLDVVAPNNPVSITRYCGHATLANSKAIELAGIDPGGVRTPDPVGGTIVRDENGEPTGVFIDTAQSLISRVIPSWPALTEDERRQALQLGSQAVLASGLTVIHDASGAAMSEVDRRKSLYEQGLLKVRINNMLSASTAFALGAPQFGLYDNHYFLQSVKVISDGSLGGRGAAMIDEYSDAPGYYGALRSIMFNNAFTEQTTNLLALGFSTRTHAIGDLANRMVLDAYEAAMAATGKTGDQARLAIEHSQIAHADDIHRWGQLGVVASMQPIHATEDMLFAEDRVGPVRILGAYAWRTFLDDGVVIASGSDYGVSPYNPFWGLYAAVTRQDRSGWPPGGWYPAQRMTREEALRSYTNGGAYVMFAEHLLGSIEPGKLADFIVIDRDYMTTRVENLWRTRNLMTVVGGEVVYTAPTVAIDVLPGVQPNIISMKADGLVPVALLGGGDLDLLQVDLESVAFAGALPQSSTTVDVDGDGDLDLLFQFNFQDLELTKQSKEGILTFLTGAGTVYQGTDWVRLVPR